MIFVLERVTQPDIEPIELAEMKRHLRCFQSVTSDDDDITGLIKGAREWVEDYTGRALVDQSWRLSLCNYLPASTGAAGTVVGSAADLLSSDGGILLRKSPVLAITSVASVSEGEETELDAGDYSLREAASKWPRIVPAATATQTELRIVFRAGFADRTGSPVDDASVIPVRFKQAMKLWAEAMYDRDQDLMPLLLDTAERLIKPERADLQLA